MVKLRQASEVDFFKPNSNFPNEVKEEDAYYGKVYVYSDDFTTIPELAEIRVLNPNTNLSTFAQELNEGHIYIPMIFKL